MKNIMYGFILALFMNTALADEAAEVFSPQRALDFAVAKLDESLELYRHGEFDQAYEAVLEGYIRGVEPLEPRLEMVAPELKEDLEQHMNAYRSAIQAQSPLKKVEYEAHEYHEQLEQAGKFTAEASLSPVTGAFSAFLVLLREGLEAILIIGAMAAFLTKTNRRHELRWLHTGWVSALVLGLVTWAVASTWFEPSESSREFAEGVAALVAAAMLVYVGWWLHRHSHAQRWQAFIKNKLGESRAGKGAIWTLVAVAFIAVYREMFETILFLQTLWLQTSENDGAIAGGVLVAAMGLAVCAWLVFRLNTRLPLGALFRANAVLLFVLAVVFTGQGIYALQETGLIPYQALSFPEVEMLGIYADAQSLAAQAILVAAGIAWVLFQRARRPIPLAAGQG